MPNWFLSFFKRFVPSPTDAQVTQQYVATGKEFGSVASNLGAMGECIGFEKYLSAWEKAEKDYSDRGFRTLSVDAFIGAGGWAERLEGLYQLREVGEPPVLHAAYYREHFLGKVGGVIQRDWAKLAAGDIISGHYAIPSTEHLLRIAIATAAEKKSSK